MPRTSYMYIYICAPGYVKRKVSKGQGLLRGQLGIPTHTHMYIYIYREMYSSLDNQKSSD